mgnify:CR=1 FL=1
MHLLSPSYSVSKNKKTDCIQAGKKLLELIKKDIKPRDIMTKKAFENAITVVIALGALAPPQQQHLTVQFGNAFRSSTFTVRSTL